MAVASDIVKRANRLKSERESHENVWKNCFDYTYPMRGDGLSGSSMDANQGAAQKARILDSTATDSSRMLASAIMSGLTPANSRWFELDVEQETEEERQWLEKAADALWLNIHQANFDAEGYEAALDVVIAGWFVLFISEDMHEGGLNFEQWPIGGCYCTSTRPDGVVNTLYRFYSRPAAAVVEEFGDDQVSEQTLKLAKDKPDELVELLREIKPREDHKEGSRFAKDLPFSSVTIEVKAAKVLRESGYHEFPCTVPRWLRIPRSSYGIGPVFDALPDIRMLNDIKAMELANGDIAIGGMWIAEDDGVLNPRTIKLGARKVVVANSVESMKALQTGADFKISEYLVTNLQAAIRKVLMSDQLQPQDGPAMTATEVHVRVQLIRQLLGPIYGRLQAEYLQPLVERCFGLAYRAGALGQAPDSLANKEFTVKYVSPMARAQRLEDVTAIERLFQDIGAMAQAKQDPGVWDYVDEGEAITKTSNGLGVPAGVLRDAEGVQQVRAKRQQAQDEMQQKQQAAMAQEQMLKAATEQAKA